MARAGVGGLDFGWNMMEGSTCFRDAGDDCATAGADAARRPSTATAAGCSVTGGTVYRGAAHPALAGLVRLRRLLLRARSGRSTRRGTGPRDPTVVAETDFSISAIAEDAAGELYATDHRRAAAAGRRRRRLTARLSARGRSRSR